MPFLLKYRKIRFFTSALFLILLIFAWSFLFFPKISLAGMVWEQSFSVSGTLDKSGWSSLITSTFNTKIKFSSQSYQIISQSPAGLSVGNAGWVCGADPTYDRDGAGHVYQARWVVCGPPDTSFSVTVKFTGEGPAPWDQFFQDPGMNIQVCPGAVSVSGNNATFNWTLSNNSQNAYWLQVDDNSDFSSITADTGAVVSTSLSANLSLPGGIYYWRVAVRSSTSGFNYWTPWAVGDSFFLPNNIGLKLYDGSQIISIACEPAGVLTSPLRIRKGDTTYGIILVDPSDPDASKIRIQTSLGIKALRKY